MKRQRDAREMHDNNPCCKLGGPLSNRPSPLCSTFTVALSAASSPAGLAENSSTDEHWCAAGTYMPCQPPSSWRPYYSACM